jgi:hypothetical protein
VAWQEHLSNTAAAKRTRAKPMNCLFYLIFLEDSYMTDGGNLKTPDEGQKCHSFVIHIGVTNKCGEFVSTV